ncbi:MAG TPA: choice-of-anchor X domain-containing protein [Thermoanaerobaculia bacterium]|nr:choice-of-anchor X domain-containing protein [Thermoanaerobaculia bacterium]
MALLFICLTPSVVAQTATQEMAAAAISHDAFQVLAMGVPVTRPILVDNTPVLSVELLAASQTLVVSLTAPNGAHYAVGDAPTSAFTSAVLPIDTVSTKPGASYIATIANPVVGTWTLSVTEPAAVSSPLDVLATIYLNNSTRLVLAGGGDSYPVGNNVRLALVAFDGAARLHGLTVAASVFRPFDPTFTPVAATFRDDGTGADEVAGDGIYEAYVNPGQPGTYQVQADVTGTASTGAFRRSTATELRVVPHNAHISGFVDRGLDDDFDGFYDRIGVTALATVSESATYRISVRLRASNGHEIQQSSEQKLTAGSVSPEVTFSATDITRDLGVDGPYQVAEVRYYELVGADFVPADIRYDLGPTSSYALSELQHNAVRLSGFAAATATDTNGNHLYDVLTIDLGIIVDFSDQYTAAVSLTDRNGREIGFASGSLFLDSGVNTITITFDGTPIGKNGVDGPYFLSNLIMYSSDQSLVVTRVFTTQPFSASQFEGFTVSKHRAVRHP